MFKPKGGVYMNPVRVSVRIELVLFLFNHRGLSDIGLRLLSYKSFWTQFIPFFIPTQKT